MLDHLHYANLCYIAYLKGAIGQYQKMGYTVQFFGADAQQFYLLKRDGVQVLVFRGSDQIADWLRNFWAMLRLVNRLPGRLHSGFMQAIEAVDQQILGQLQPIPTIVLGHSAGGAAAMLTALEILDVIQVVTFGSPMVGDREFCAEYDRRLGAQTTRYVYGFDPVPYLPCGIGYAHAGQQIRLNPPPHHWQVFARFGIVRSAGLLDHLMPAYIKAIGDRGSV